jgi:hypothetical protein
MEFFEEVIFVRVVAGHGTDIGSVRKYMTAVGGVFWCRSRGNHEIKKSFGVI